jgi:hypothetical protein
MRGSDSRWSVVGWPGFGGIQGWVLGSGMMVMGMPRLKKVEWGIEREGDSIGLRRPGGREEDTMGLSVRRLWISGFRFGRVRTPVVWLLVVVRAELAASAGVVRRAEDVGGRSFREL